MLIVFNLVKHNNNMATQGDSHKEILFVLNGFISKESDSNTYKVY